MSERYSPRPTGMFTRLCGSCGTVMARDIIERTCWCLNDKCPQYKGEFRL